MSFPEAVDFFKKLTPMHVGIGVIIGFIASPLIAAILAMLIPVAAVLLALAAAAAAYAKFKLKATFSDWLLLKGVVGPRIQQLVATKYNHTTDIYWYQQYDKLVASQNTSKTLFVSAEDDSEHSWEDIERLSNRVAQWGARYPVNMTVALFMPNRPEYVAMWLGNAKIGLVTALINTNLRKAALVHSITAGECKALVYDAELADALKEISEDVKALNIPLFQYGGDQALANSLNATLLIPELDKQSSLRLEKERSAGARGAKYSETVFLIYTSGTTGLPKAAKITHHRFRLIGGIFGGLFASGNDRLYCPLPLYHSAGGMIGIGTAFQTGCCVVLRKKFTASGFVKDCVKHKCTAFQYIGELARYLLATKEDKESESQLTLKWAVGNGLRPDVWRPFKDRFHIGAIREFYGATEGATALFNVGDVDHSIGYMSPVINKIMPMAIVKFDQNKEECIRGPDGRCIPCEPLEAGEFIAQIKVQMGASNYSGYTDKAASDKKVLRNVFKEGDEWFRSGDLLKADEFHNVFFVDRIGDTFRWKGENCATSEVANAFGTFQGTEANVYGVEVPKNDGRAGMAALYNVDADKFDFEGLAKHLIKELPRYAIPLFLRVVAGTGEVTSTFKHQKVNLRKEGFDLNIVKDKLFFFDGKVYVPLTADIAKKIQSGDIRV